MTIWDSALQLCITVAHGCFERFGFGRFGGTGADQAIEDGSVVTILVFIEGWWTCVTVKMLKFHEDPLLHLP